MQLGNSALTTITCSSANSISLVFNTSGVYEWYEGDGTNCTYRGDSTYAAGNTFRISADGHIYKNGVQVAGPFTMASPVRALTFGGDQANTAGLTSATITY